MPTVKSSPQGDATIRLLRTGWHPIQIKALTILTERVASSKEIAAELGIPVVGNVSYHVRALERRNLVEVVRREQRRGATETFFKATQRPLLTEEELAQLSVEEREELQRFAITCITGDFGMALDAGTLSARPDRHHLSRTPLQLDEQGFKDLIQEMNGLLDRALEIQAESDERRSQSGEDASPASAVFAFFPMPAGIRPTNRQD